MFIWDKISYIIVKRLVFQNFSKYQIKVFLLVDYFSLSYIILFSINRQAKQAKSRLWKNYVQATNNDDEAVKNFSGKVDRFFFVNIQVVKRKSKLIINSYNY